MPHTTVVTDLRVHALGPVRVTREGVDVGLGGPRQRRLLAVLLMHRGAVVSVDRVAEAVFAGEPTEAAATTLRSYVARLRRVLGEGVLLTRAPGYQLVVPAEAFDVLQFENAVVSARTALQRQDPAGAADLVRGALALWEGDAYAEFADEEWAFPEAQRLAELRLTARELLAEAELDCGHTAEQLPSLEALRREHPLREAIRGLLMTAYYRAGRQADALAELRAFRQELADELGIDPSPALVDLERRILEQDPTLTDVPGAGEPLRGYLLGERLGSGRDGVVHAAQLPGVERPLAVRTLRAEVADDPGFIRAFEATAHRVASLRHPAVLPIHDYWREPGAAYVVMPRLTGGTLRDRLRRGPLPAAELLRLVERIGGALLAAADAELVHGRVSAENVLYDGEEPVLTDFWLGGPHPPDPEADVRDLAALVREAGGPDPTVAEGTALPDLVLGVLEALGDEGGAVTAQANPYQGLQAFDESDADNYFGRTELIDDVSRRLSAGIRLILLVGASGTGKSSAVRAGLLPRLRAGERSRDWFVATMLPAGAPYAELAAALNRIAVAPTTGLAERMASDGEEGIDAALREVVPDGGQLLLVVDQFEELFTLSPEADQRAFLQALTAAITAPGSRLRVVATLRADFYDRPLAVQPFGSLVGEATVAIPAMLPAEVEAAVVEPARRAGRQVDRALAAELVGSVASEPAALPALQFVLYELAERSPDGHLTMAGYRELGGLEGAIAARAEELYQSLDDEDRKRARELFERLVVVGEGEPTRRRATREEIAEAEEIVDRWAAARLLTLDVHPQTRMPTVEVAHEALVREWPRLREWIEDDRSDLVVLGRLRESARAWSELGYDASALLRGTALEAALDVAARRTHLPAIQEVYIEESRLYAEEDRVRQGQTIRRLRLQLAGIGVMLVLALVGGFVALDQRREAVTQRHNATARELAAAANESLRDDTERSILLALAAIDATRRSGEPVLPEAEEALHRAVSTHRLLRSFPDEGGALDWSDDGRYFATEGPEETGLLTVRDARDGRAVRQWQAEDSDVNEVDYSPDARRIASVGDDGTLRVWDTGTGRKVSEVRGPTSRVVAATFSPDGRVVAAGWPEGGVVKLARARDGKVVGTLESSGSALDFSPDSTRLAVSAGEGQVTVYDWRSSRRLLVLEGVDGGSEVDWSPDGKWIAVAQGTGSAVVFDAASGERRFETYGHTGPINAVAWNHDSGALATGSNDGTIRVFELSRGALVESLVLSAHALHDGVRSVAWSPDGNALMATAWSITGALVFDLRPTAGAEVGSLTGQPGADRGVAFMPDGQSAWVAGPDGSVSRRELPSGRKVQELSRPAQGWAPRLFLSPDGGLLAVAEDGPLPVFDTATGELAFRVAVPWTWDVTWSPDGQHLAVQWQAAADGSGQGQEVPQGQVLVADRTGRTVARLSEDPGMFALAMTFAADGRLLAVTRGPDMGHPRDREIAVWDWREERRVRTFAANSELLAAGGKGSLIVSVRLLQGVADVFDAATGKRVTELEGHAGVITGIAFDDPGERVATVSSDGSARIWDARRGTLLSALRGPPSIGQGEVAFSPDGKRLVTTWDDGISRIWTLDLAELVGIAQERLTRGFTTAECKQYLHTDRCPGQAR